MNRHRVNPGEWFVEQNERGLARQAAGDLQPAAFPPGERARERTPQPGQAELIEQIVCHAAALGAADMQHLQNGENILFDSQFAEHARLLGEIAHSLLCPLEHRPVGHVDAIEHDRAGGWLDHPTGHAEAGRFAGAVWPQQPDDLARLDIKGDVVHDGPGTVDFLEASALQTRRHVDFLHEVSGNSKPLGR